MDPFQVDVRHPARNGRALLINTDPLGQVAQAAQAAAHASTQLTAAIRQAHLSGHTPEAIATATGLPHAEIHRAILSD